MKKHKVTILKGSIPEQGAEWWAEKDWEDHQTYVKELKEKGEYLQPVELDIYVNEDPLWDYPNNPNPLESYRMTFLNNDDKT